MSRRSGGGVVSSASSRKDVSQCSPRRSGRERQALYTSLDENFLLETAISSSLFRALINDADKSCDSKKVRQSRSLDLCKDINCRSPDVNLCDGIVGDRLESPLDEDNKSVHVPNMYESVKRRRQALRQAAIEHSINRDVGCKKEAVGVDTATDSQRNEVEDEEDSESSSQQPRHYLLRTNRHPVSRYGIEDGIQRSMRSIRLDLQRRIRRNISRRDRKRDRRRRGEHWEDSDDSSSSLSESASDISIGVEEKRRRYERICERNSSNDDDQGGRFVAMNFYGEEHNGLMCKSSEFDVMNVDRTITFDKIGGLDHHIRSLKEMILFPLFYPDVFTQYNVKPPKGVLFYGPPGTGKTLMARALANACSIGARKVAFFMRKGTECFSKFFGESERHLRRLFKQAYDSRPSIIFFDEIDGLAPSRTAREDHSYTSVVSTLLALMDGLDCRGEVIVIGATNRLDAIDPALRRPGRFDRELRFGLPDMNARVSILKVATSSWKTKRPSENDLELLAEKTVGYCGADLKSLCVEAVFIALRRCFPQIYISDEKLVIDPTKVIVTNEHFFTAMKRIVPAASRDFTTPSRRLDERSVIVVGSILDELIENHIPIGYRKPLLIGNEQPSDVFSSSQIEKVLRELDTHGVIPSVRILLHGKSSDYGQTSYVLPAVMNRLDNLPVFSLSLGSLYALGNPEESLSQLVQSALRTACTGTACILLLPSLDEWHHAVSLSVWYRLVGALNGFGALTPIMLLATSNSHYSTLPYDVQKLFCAEDVIEIEAPDKRTVEKYFRYIIVENGTKRSRKFIATDYPRLPTAPKENEEQAAGAASSKSHSMKLREEDVKELKRRYHECRLKLIVKYEESIHRLYRDRRFQAFARPVDARVVPDYYDLITKPMDLSTMYRKVELYETPQQLLDDFYLIYSNALHYNSDADDEGQHLRFLAKLLLDMGKEIVFSLDRKLVKSMEEIKKSLSKAGITDWDSIDDESGECEEAISVENVLISNDDAATDNQHVIATSRLLTALECTETKQSSSANLDAQQEQQQPELSHHTLRKTNKRRGGSLNAARFRSQKSRKLLAKKRRSSMDTSATSISANSGLNAHLDADKVSFLTTAGVRKRKQEDVNEELENEDTRSSLDHTDCPLEERCSNKVSDISSSPFDRAHDVVCTEALENVVHKVVSKTSAWPIVQLERLGAELIQVISQHHHNGLSLNDGDDGLLRLWLPSITTSIEKVTPMGKIPLIINKNIAVNYFGDKDSSPTKSIKYRFLTHARGNATYGLTCDWEGEQVYCTLETAKLLKVILEPTERHQFIDSKWVTALEMNKRYKLDKLWVTALDSNHVRGSAMFIFDGPALKHAPVLCTGDIRADLSFYSKPSRPLPLLNEYKFDRIYLDSTYLSYPDVSFPSRLQSVKAVIEKIAKIPQQSQIYLITQSVGREQFLVDLCTYLKASTLRSFTLFGSFESIRNKSAPGTSYIRSRTQLHIRMQLMIHQIRYGHTKVYKTQQKGRNVSDSEEDEQQEKERPNTAGLLQTIVDKLADCSNQTEERDVAIERFERETNIFNLLYAMNPQQLARHLRGLRRYRAIHNKERNPERMVALDDEEDDFLDYACEDDKLAAALKMLKRSIEHELQSEIQRIK
ncbi:unnamed protein product [Anisakis simplex]|uniref:Tat-binding homolog 7 (inferred by orthology to a C. elegans protein) n=1 Tax=Anisakis simplex TaxID=6269 RepID=A0A0M3JXM4_ANISI|nr:unnamed protein product [Anisakis simplex]